MPKTTAAALVAVAALALTLTACSDQTPPVAEDATAIESETPTAAAPVEHIGDTWTFEYEGATGTFTIPTDSSNELVQQLEAARESVGGEAPTYVTVEVDNTSGTSYINMYGMTLVSLDGQQAASTSVSDVISEWRSLTEDTATYNSLIDLSNTVGMFDLRPGATGTAVLTFAEPITSVASVYVQPAGGTDEVQATAE